MIHLIVGNTGSGKTTYAQKLKAETNGVIFSIDAWNKLLFLPDKKKDDGLHWMLERINRVESMIFSLIEQLERAKVDSILDLGFSKIDHRAKFRNFAKQNQMKCRLHFLDVSKETRKQRVLNRNLEKGDTFEFEVTLEDFQFMESWFETPSASELEGGITIIEEKSKL